MTARVTNEVMRWPMRISRRFPWKQVIAPGSASIKGASLCRHGLINQTFLGGSLCATRFYSQVGNHNEDLKESHSLTSDHSPSTDVVDQTSPGQRLRSSPFVELLRRCGSPSDVLDLTCKYAPTTRQVSNCLTHMWFSMKKMTDEQRRYELQLMFDHPEFEPLLQRAMRSIQHMRNEDVAYSLLSMVNLGVPQRSRVIQNFLRTCQVSSLRLSSTLLGHCVILLLTPISIHSQIGETEWLWWEDAVHLGLCSGPNKG